MQQAFDIGQIYKFRLKQLVRSPINVRSKTERNSEKYKNGVQNDLAPLIKAQGLLQNLIGFVQMKGKKQTGVIEIVGGGRRLDAIIYLAQTGQIDPETFEIEVKICTVAEAIEKSLAENSGREDLHPADQFRGFLAMKNEGKSIEEIATTFGVNEVTIERRLKLANVSPRLFELYESDDATLDQLMALALTDDHTKQEQVWESLGQYNRSHHRIRNLITSQAIDTKTNLIAKFVGVDEYEAAGGAVVRDLFSDNGDGFMKDAALLESLAVEKLKRLTPELEGAGWAWIDYRTSFDYDDKQRFHRARMTTGELTEEQRTKRDELQARADELRARSTEIEETLPDDAGEEEENAAWEQCQALDKEADELEEQVEAIENSVPRVVEPAYAKLAGVVVTLDYQGKLEKHEGMIRPEDKKEMQGAEAQRRAEAGEPPLPTKEKAVHSEKLVRQMTGHRTAALQVLMSQQSNVALVILLDHLANQVFMFGRQYRSYSEKVVQIGIEHTDVSKEGESVASGRALAKFAEIKMAWEDRLPTKAEDLFDWLSQQDQQTLLDLLAFCTAYTMNAMQSRDEVTDISRARAVSNYAKALKLDMADWWEPTRETYFAQVSKQHIIDVVSQNVSPEVALPMADMKKIPLCETAEQHMAGKRWLPGVLKVA